MSILDEIVVAKRLEIQTAKIACDEKKLRAGLAKTPAVRDFAAAVGARGGINIIAEIKKASPSAGIIRADFDAPSIASVYEAHGGAAISVLTDARYFRGGLHDLQAVRARVAVPLLRKDFILDSYQIVEARLYGADAVLLIAEILDQTALCRLVHEARELGMAALVEIHDATNLARALESGSRLIGINNRNLHTFETRLEHTLDLLPKVPAGFCIVSESGIRDRADLLMLEKAGVSAVLIGETLMRARDIGLKLDSLTGSTSH